LCLPGYHAFDKWFSAFCARSHDKGKRSQISKSFPGTLPGRGKYPKAVQEAIANTDEVIRSTGAGSRQTEGKMAPEVSVPKNYQWWREQATSTENDATDGQGATAPEQPDCVQAQQRAAAAAMIAEEANAARLKALLDAAREQADQNTILSAEKRFNEARDDWETARDALSAQGKSQDSAHGSSETPFAVDIADAVNRVLKRVSPQQKAISLGVVVALLLGVGVGTGGYFMLNTPPGGSATSERITVASEQSQRLVKPAQSDSTLANSVASSESLPSTNDVLADPIIVPASTKTAAAPGNAVINPIPAVVRRKPKRIYSITLPAASEKAVTATDEQSARHSTSDRVIRVNTRQSGVARAPVAPPARNPRVAASDLQVVPPPPPKPPVQIEEAE
jgi:hypothetical protein